MAYLQKEFNDGKVGFDFLKDYERIIQGLEDTDYSDGSKKVIYTSILHYLKDREGFDEARAMYTTVHQEYRREENERIDRQEPTEKQKESYVPWKDILEAVEKQFERMDDHWSFQDYLILCLYTMNAPVRLDYAGMRVVRGEPESKEGNYLLLKPRAAEFIFNQFKTSHSMGQQRVKVAPKLLKVIKEWLKMTPEPDVLLINKDGTHMTEKTLGKRIAETFQEVIGKRVSVNTLRHSYSTQYHSGSKSITKKTEDARKMLHTAPTNERYAFKN